LRSNLAGGGAWCALPLLQVIAGAGWSALLELRLRLTVRKFPPLNVKF
jgi:hypothetical protein